jgi:hypothetical protein
LSEIFSIFTARQAYPSLRTDPPIVRRYHHLGIPTNLPRDGESYLPQFKVYVSGFDTSPYGIEWMRYEPGSSVPELVRTVPHVAFEVDDLQQELIGKNILIQPNSPSDGVIVAFIVDDGAPVELLQISRAPVLEE